MIRELPWRLLAAILSRPAVYEWLVRRAMRTPYTHITSADVTETYMGRWWLFNPYPAKSDGRKRKWADWLPSARIHHIVRADVDRHLHDHPWNARTIVLRGWYREELPAGAGGRRFRWRSSGDTGRLLFGEYHRVHEVSPGGVWTLFITWRYRGTWGFDVDGRKVPWREYLGIKA